MTLEIVIEHLQELLEKNRDNPKHYWGIKEQIRFFIEQVNGTESVKEKAKRIRVT